MTGHKAVAFYAPPRAALSPRDAAFDWSGLLTQREVVRATGISKCSLSGLLRRGELRVVRTPLGLLYEAADAARIRCEVRGRLRRWRATP